MKKSSITGQAHELVHAKCGGLFSPTFESEILDLEYESQQIDNDKKYSYLYNILVYSEVVTVHQSLYTGQARPGQAGGHCWWLVCVCLCAGEQRTTNTQHTNTRHLHQNIKQ